jgi:translation initiation factor IF-3
LRINRQIRADKVRVIDEEGRQLGVMLLREALDTAELAGLDLVEVAPGAEPPVCKITDYGKLRYEQSKKEKEGRKAQHVIKVKEIKVSATITEHDLGIKVRQARGFLEKGNKVKVSCFLRGRENARPEVGQKIVQRVAQELDEYGVVESMPKQLGRTMILIMAPKPRGTVKAVKPAVSKASGAA